MRQWKGNAVLQSCVGDPNAQGLLRCLCDPPPPGMEQNTLVRFCLIVKRVNCTGLDVDICCEPEHQDFIVSIYLAGGGMPQTELMFLISSLSWKECGLSNLSGLI